VALVITDVSEECSISIVKVTRIGELRTLAVVSHTAFLLNVRWLLITANSLHSSYILFTLIMEVLISYETFVLKGSTLRNIPENGILQTTRSHFPKKHNL
jgi:hypothetical protein